MRHPVLLIVLFALACAGLLRLGLWQLDRAEVKRIRHSAYLAGLEARPVEFDSLPATATLEPYRWRKTRLHGHYLNTQVLFDNRHQAGRSGYEVLTPFKTEGQRTVLVNRGFIALGGSRSELPEVSVGSDTVTLDAYLGDAPVVGLALNSEASSAEQLAPDMIRIQRLDFGGMGQMLGYELWPGVAYLNAKQPGALSVDWPVPGDGSKKHQAYAVQWFSMAAVLAAIGLFNFARGRRRHG